MKPSPEQPLRWPAERFYWALVDAPGLKKAGLLPPGLIGSVAEEVPVAVEELHAVCVPTVEGKALVCAARALDMHALGASGRASSLTPESLPPGVQVPVDPACLNLLVGGFEPPAQRRRRVRLHLTALATVAATLTLITVGLARRASHWSTVASDARASIQELVTRVVPTGGGDGGRPDAVAMELASLKQATDSLARVKPAPDAPVALATLLAGWPASVPSKPQSITVSETGITVSVSVDGDPAPFLRAFAPPTGWVMAEPRLNSSDNLTRVVIELRRAGEGGAAP